MIATTFYINVKEILSSIWNNLIMVCIKQVMSQNLHVGAGGRDSTNRLNVWLPQKNLGRVTPIIPGAGTPPKSWPLIGRSRYWSSWVRISTCSLQIFLIKYFLVSCTKIQHGHTVAFGTKKLESKLLVIIFYCYSRFVNIWTIQSSVTINAFLWLIYSHRECV